MSERAQSLKIYWCSACGARDPSGADEGFEWFVAAEGARRARRFFAAQLGCREDDVSSTLVSLSTDARDVGLREGWPPNRVLERCGVRFIVMRFGTELVELGGKIHRVADVRLVDAARTRSAVGDAHHVDMLH